MLCYAVRSSLLAFFKLTHRFTLEAVASLLSPAGQGLFYSFYNQCFISAWSVCEASVWFLLELWAMRDMTLHLVGVLQKHFC